MPTNGTERWKSLEQRSAAVFLVAGALVSVAAVAMGAVLVTDMTQGMATGLPLVVGLLVSYVGLLGLYPRLARGARRAALTGVALLAAPVAGLLIILGYALLVGSEPSFIGALLAVVFVGFALGVVLFGATSYRMRVPSRGVGVALLAFAAPWFVLLGSRLVYAEKAPAWLDFATTGVMGVTLLAIGYLLRAGTHRTERAEPASDPTT